ncbi:hypothetical protein ENBRE01_0321 [Enteropsectra breve]|nr:hypothetical protein ENBRE01_0321 [Enteropsectra breve]
MPTFTIPAVLQDGKNTHKDDSQSLAEFRDIMLCIGGLSIRYYTIKGLTTKNTEDKFLLQIKGDSITTLAFESAHVRDFVKGILSYRTVPLEKIHRRIIESELEFKGMGHILRGIYKNADELVKILISTVVQEHEGKLPTGHLILDAYAQPKASSTVFLDTLNQSIVNTFTAMQTSFNQYYNRYCESFYHTGKNKPATIDRMLMEEVLGRSDMDAAARINMRSILSLSNLGCQDLPNIKRNIKPGIQLGAVYPFAENTNSTDHNPISHSNCPETQSGNDPGENHMNLNLNRLKKINIVKGIMVEKKNFNVNPKDFEISRELCKIVCRNGGILDKTGKEYVEAFKNGIEDKYGKRVTDYCACLIPDFYTKQ